MLLLFPVDDESLKEWQRSFLCCSIVKTVTLPQSKVVKKSFTEGENLLNTQQHTSRASHFEFVWTFRLMLTDKLGVAIGPSLAIKILKMLLIEPARLCFRVCGSRY